MERPPSTGNRFERGSAAVKSRAWPVLNLISALLVIGLFLEGISFGALSLYRLFSGREDPLAAHDLPRKELDVYDEAKWADRYFEEFALSYRTEYFPYTGYRRVAGFTGKHVNLDDEGRRRTVPDCGRGATDVIDIFVFGGSAVWGTGARDEGTIPSLLARELCEQDIAVTVTNYGETGYTNTQEMFLFQMALQRGRIPDVAIFYDGVNDVYSSYQNREPGLPQNVANRQVAHEVTLQPRFMVALIGLALATNTGQIAKKLLQPLLESPASRQSGEPKHYLDAELDRATVNVLRRNARMIRALEREFGFRSFFYWQPALYTKHELSSDERTKIEKDGVFSEMYLRVTEIIKGRDFIRDLSDALDEFSRSFYIDEFHIAEEGNEIIAKIIASDIIQQMALDGDGMGAKPRRKALLE